MSALTKSTNTSGPARSFGVLLSHAFENQVHGNFSTRLLAGVEAHRIAGAQPGIEFEIMETTPDGWRSADGRTADQVAGDRWGA